MYVLSLEGLPFYGYHGVSEHERELGHHYSMDLLIQVEGTTPQTDSLADGVDYGDLAAIALEAASRSCRTIERLAQSVSEAVLARFTRVVSVTVRVRKLQPPMPFPARAACVEVTLGRSGAAP